MGSIDTFQCSSNSAGGLERVRYFPRQLLTADEMRVEQEYFLEKQRRHNRFLHGWGVVCGLLVKANAVVGPLAVSICPGYALSPCGNEIYVPDAVRFDLTATTQQLAQPACARPGFSAAALDSGLLAIMIRYVECQTRPVRTMPAGCGCDETDCEFSRIRDGFEIRAVPTDGKSEVDTTPGLCQIQKDIPGQLPPFPPVPTSDWIQLAVINLKGGPVVSDKLIDNGNRRVLYSTAQIQHQVIDGICKAV